MCYDWIVRYYNILEILRSYRMRYGKSFRFFSSISLLMTPEWSKPKKNVIQTLNRHNAVQIGHLHLIRLNGIVTYDLQFQNELLTIQIHTWHFTLITSLLNVNTLSSFLSFPPPLNPSTLYNLLKTCKFSQFCFFPLFFL